MARSRQKYRRSTTRSAASLLALALPAPMQRVANSQLGPLLIFFGIPALLVIGLLQVNWENGTPHLTVNAQKATELRDTVKGQLGNLENQPVVQYWQQTALDAWNAQQHSQQQHSQQQYSQQQYPQQQYPQQQYPQQQYPQQQYPQQQYSQQQYPQQQYSQQQSPQLGSLASSAAATGWATSNSPVPPLSGAAARNSPAPFPSTNPPASQTASPLGQAPQAAAVQNYSQYQQQQQLYQQQQYQQQSQPPWQTR